MQLYSTIVVADQLLVILFLLRRLDFWLNFRLILNNLNVHVRWLLLRTRLTFKWIQLSHYQRLKPLYFTWAQILLFFLQFSFWLIKALIIIFVAQTEMPYLFFEQSLLSFVVTALVVLLATLVNSRQLQQLFHQLLADHIFEHLSRPKLIDLINLLDEINFFGAQSNNIACFFLDILRLVFFYFKHISRNWNFIILEVLFLFNFIALVYDLLNVIILFEIVTIVRGWWWWLFLQIWNWPKICWSLLSLFCIFVKVKVWILVHFFDRQNLLTVLWNHLTIAIWVIRFVIIVLLWIKINTSER